MIRTLVHTALNDSAMHEIILNDCEPEIDPPPMPRYRPPSIDTICKQTKFTRKEIQIIYRAFKQGSPNGTIGLEQFQEIYFLLFPAGRNTKYAEYVFRTFDRDEDKIISFEEFVSGLSVISRGTTVEKLNWIFTLYDIDKKGVIGHSELMKISQSMFDLIGRNTGPPVTYQHLLEHASTIVQRMDANKDGLITRQEFMDACTNDESMCRSIESFHTWF
ncbi:ncs-7 [Pristionchus pacificus]|uniref:Ncs-7 n=1 Tax=Pristionchus pacificus TaxID=54126 RepID=A0A2A6D0Y9_PRIPA|nr:ncs-7 [Pristionchus pacificus]|eukprot:PDM83987.1 ncs-7 [Pristionchus pacificus]